MHALIDSHCHLDATAFDSDRAAVIDRARAAGIVAQVIPGVAPAGWDGLRELCQRHPGLHPAYGLHPLFLAGEATAALDALARWLDADADAVAIGECGLDFADPDDDPRRQQAFFEGQLDLAGRRGLPVILHARRALDPVLAALRRRRGLRGVVHSFSGSLQQARQLWDLGFLLGIGGPVTYARAQRLRGVVAAMPPECLLLETDSPDQPDCDWRGRRNEPARLARILAEVAMLRGEDPAELAAATTANARRLFALPAIP